MAPDRYLPALRFRALTRFYDGVIALGMPEKRFRDLLLERALPRRVP